MNALPKIDMMEATRLTRAGRLTEALTVLRGPLPTAPLAEASFCFEDKAPETSSAAPRRIRDMAPPVMGIDGACTSPQFKETAARGVSQPRIPEALRAFLKHIKQSRSARPLDGLTAPGPRRPLIPLPEGARFEERSYANQAGSRAYKLYVPSGYHGRALPLVIMLHGCTQSPDDFAAGTRMNDLAEEQTFLVGYPAQAPSANVSKCWNWFNADQQQRDRGEPSLIAGITRQIMRDFPVEPGRVYIAGLSAGGAAAAIMGATYPELYAAIGVHSGLACGAARDMPSALAAMRQGGPSGRAGLSRQSSSQRVVPTIVFHGDRDTTVNPVNGDQVILQSKGGADLRASVSRGKTSGGMSYTRTIQADGSGRTVVEQWIVHGAGHAWSGGSAAGSYTESRGPDASREMLRFFLQHSTSAQARGNSLPSG